MKDSLFKIRNIFSGKTPIYVLLFMASVILIFGIELVFRGDFYETISWTLQNSNSFILNCIISFMLYLFIFSFINNLFFSTAIYLIFIMFISFLNTYKYKFLGEFLYPWDLLLYNQVFDLLPLLYKEINIKYVFPIILFLLIIIFVCIKKRYIAQRYTLSFPVRLISATLCLATIVSLAFYQSTPAKNLLDTMNIENIVWQQEQNYKTNGFLLSFIMNWQSAVIIPPKDYSNENIIGIIENIKNNLSASAVSKGNRSTNKENKPPNIIIVMNEAFWDPTELDNIIFDSDPIPTVRKNQNGWLLSPQFGGGTSNVEFEALTGLSVNYLPNGSIAYQQYINKPLPSLASILKESGYNSVAIHPYHKWFWNREKVYQYLGFDKFVSIEDFKNPKLKGYYISDDDVNEAIIQHTEKSESPVFIYAITMQNHGPYNDLRYNSNSIKIKGDLPEKSLQILETYTQGVFEADTALKNLLDYFHKSVEPTIVVFFGDHLPYLGEDYSLYRESKYIRYNNEEKWSLDEHRRMKSTPLVIWTNYSEEKQVFEAISPSFLAPNILKLAGIKQPLFYDFLEQFQNYLPGYTSKVEVDINGKLYEETPKDLENIERVYQLLQYDLLFGEQYGLKYLFKR